MVKKMNKSPNSLPSGVIRTRLVMNNGKGEKHRALEGVFKRTLLSMVQRSMAVCTEQPPSHRAVLTSPARQERTIPGVQNRKAGLLIILLIKEQ